MSYKSDYQFYLKTDHWKDLRLRKLAQVPWCEVCGTKENRQVHHLRYKSIIDCDLDDLMTLCESCHKDYHLAQENLGWTINNSYEAVSMVRYFRTLPDYAPLKDSKPNGKPPKRQKRDPFGRFKSDANNIMARYRNRRPLTPDDLREMISKLQILIASQP